MTALSLLASIERGKKDPSRFTPRPIHNESVIATLLMIIHSALLIELWIAALARCHSFGRERISRYFYSQF
jgi:hypothetical protein